MAGILGNLKLKRRGRDVTVGVDEEGNPVTLRVSPPPLGLVNQLEREIPRPTAPMRKDNRGRPVPVTDDRGKPVIDGATGQALMERDLNDPAYQERLEARDLALNVALILRCLGDQVSPSVTREQHGGDPIAYYQAVWAELEEAGLDIGVYRALSSACTQLSLPLGDEDMKLAREALAVDDDSQAEIKAALREEGAGKVQGK